jgi:hypothetical protein
MMRSKLARHLSDAALGELGRQLSYKAGWYGLELVTADRWYASSKTCSKCGVKNAEFDREPVFWCADERAGTGRTVTQRRDQPRPLDREPGGDGAARSGRLTHARVHTRR